MAQKPKDEETRKENARVEKAAMRVANQISRAIYRLRNSSPSVRERFFRTGRSHVFDSVPPNFRDLARLFAYENLAPCSDSEPGWVVSLRSRQRRPKLDSFECIRRTFGEAEWSKASRALIEYRRWKGFHRTWNALWYSVRNSRLQVGPGNTLLVIPSSDATKKIAGIYTKLGHNAAKKTLKAGLSRYGENAALLATKLALLANSVDALIAVYKDSKTNRLAGLAPSHPDVMQYKLHFFVALMAEGPEFYKLLDRYRKYDALYRTVQHYVDLERQLDGRTVNQRHDTIGPVKRGTVRRRGRTIEPVYSESNRPYADAAL